ncbi:MAG: hypothetical protein ACLRSW_05485 [Christensenellaceae bacterium]
MKLLVRDYSSFGIQQTIAGGTYAERGTTLPKTEEIGALTGSGIRFVRGRARATGPIHPLPAIAAARTDSQIYPIRILRQPAPQLRRPTALRPDSERATYAIVSAFVEEVNPMRSADRRAPAGPSTRNICWTISSITSAVRRTGGREPSLLHLSADDRIL